MHTNQQTNKIKSQRMNPVIRLFPVTDEMFIPVHTIPTAAAVASLYQVFIKMHALILTLFTKIYQINYEYYNYMKSDQLLLIFAVISMISLFAFDKYMYVKMEMEKQKKFDAKIVELETEIAILKTKV